MKIKRLFELNKQIISKEFDEFTFILGKSSDVFDFFGVEEMHGLKKSECYDRPDNSYIAGLCNVYPNDHSKIFLFINEVRLGNDYKDVLLIMHETMHLSLQLHGYNLEDGDLEEKVITWSEEMAEKIYQYLLKTSKIFYSTNIL
jgi:hypothetical protein